MVLVHVLSAAAGALVDFSVSHCYRFLLVKKTDQLFKRSRRKGY
jgi:hypothetical protein